jgi:tetratricopeptide (TPR) repeat protein
LVQIRDAAQQRAYILDSSCVSFSELVELLSEKIRVLAWDDPAQAEILVATNLYVASVVQSARAFAFATRSQAEVLYTTRRSAEAQPHFERSVGLFLEARLPLEAARTLITMMDNLVRLGRYDEALKVESRARAALEGTGDSENITRLEVALGNLCYRLDQYAKALAHYDSAIADSDDPSTMAAVIGRAHVLTDMNRFDEAMEAWTSAKRLCEQHDLATWVDIVDRGMAKMHGLRGNYSTALRILEQSRRNHQSRGDSFRVALCDLERTRFYLELNLFDDASSLAARAAATFEKLGNRYEQAMCLTFLGRAESKLSHDPVAESAFVQAHDIFREEGNRTWAARVDRWRAELLIQENRFAEAQELASRAAVAFKEQGVPVQAADARVLLAESLRKLNSPESAMAEAGKALDELHGFQAPWVSYHAFNELGQIHEAAGDDKQAEACYVRAVSEIESLRGNIQLDEMRLSFGKDKYQVYENIVNLKLNRGDSRIAFDFAERSKSRTLIDLLERNLETVWDAGVEGSPRMQRIRKIREELNILYNRLNDAGATGRVLASDTATKDEIGKRERELVELLRQIGSEKSGWAKLQTMELPNVGRVQEMLAADEVLIEYYSIGDRIQAFVIGREGFHVLRDLGTMGSVRASLKGLTFQLAKFHLESDYIVRHADVLLEAITHHLQLLHRQLFQPLQHLLRTRRLIIVPHQVLHYVPFHALFDGERYVIDDHDVTYSASASVLKICRERKTPPEVRQDLILAVSDKLTPQIDEEAEALRELSPTAHVFTGSDANEDKLRQYGPSAGKIHIAAHGIFRADSPMFSSLRLGDTWLNLFDIFNLHLGAELITLSACETGMSAVSEGDELLGLARGFLYAGTPSLVVSLWTVNDRSTAQLMRRFYEGLREGLGKAHALRQAILDLKKDFPHPYYWAPFILLGKS